MKTTDEYRKHGLGETLHYKLETKLGSGGVTRERDQELGNDKILRDIETDGLGHTAPGYFIAP